jgi:phosphoglycerate kinase
MDDFDFRDKRVLVRVDLNLPYFREKNELGDSKRLVEHAKTIKELADKGARVVVLAHQGRPGEADFLPLVDHAAAFSRYIGKPVKYVDDIHGSRALGEIQLLRPGDILLLENVRFLAEENIETDPETHTRSHLVTRLAPCFDAFVMDAFSAAHRSHASMTGFSKTLPSFSGRVMQRELVAASKAVDSVERPSVLVLGGAKVEECLDAANTLLARNNVDAILTSGVIGELLLMASGRDLGRLTTDFLARKGYFELMHAVEKLWQEHKEKIQLPEDVAVEAGGKRQEMPVSALPAEFMLMDIGEKTAKKYARVLLAAKTINIKGPAGVFEHPEFTKGTWIVLDAIARSEGFSLIAGGHTLSAIHKLGFREEDFGHVSLGGGACLTILAGKPLPAVEALRQKTEAVARDSKDVKQ